MGGQQHGTAKESHDLLTILNNNLEAAEDYDYPNFPFLRFCLLACQLVLRINTHTSSDGHTADQFQVHTDRVVLKTRRMVSTLVRNACEHPLKHAACQIWRPTFFEHIHTGGLPSRRPSV